MKPKPDPCHLDHTHEATSTAAALTQPGAVSTVPTMVRGDWVLFHPVYTQEELKAVEVRHLFIKPYFHVSLPSPRYYIETPRLCRTSWPMDW